MDVGDASSGQALGRVLGVLVNRLLARGERRGRTLRAVALSARLIAGGGWRERVVFRQPLADRERIWLALSLRLLRCPPPAATLRLAVERFGPPAERAGGAARRRIARPARRADACARPSRRCARSPARTRRCAPSASIPTRACPSAASVLDADPGVGGRRGPCSTAAGRRGCAGRRTAPRRGVRRRSDGARCASRGWSRTAGGRRSRCGAATGSWSTSRGRNVVVFHDLPPAAGSAQGVWDDARGRSEGSAMTPTPPLRRAALPLGLLVPGRRLAAGGAGARRGRARLRGARADRPQLGLGLDGAGPGRGRLRRARDPRRGDRRERGRGGAGASATSRPLTLLVRDERGWRNLCRIITLAHAHTREGSARRERGEPSVELEAVLDHAEGLVCLTGCAERSAIGDRRPGRGRADRDGAAPARGVRRRAPAAWSCSARTRATIARATARWRRSRGGWGSRAWRRGDVHAHARTRAELQDAFVALRHHATLDASEPLRRGNHSHVMSSPQAMARRFADHPEAVRETLLLAEQLTFDLTQGPRLPLSGRRGHGGSRRKLAELCGARLRERYGRRARRGAALAAGGAGAPGAGAER